MKDELTARYKSYSLAQLMEVLENKHEYTSLAIEIAEQEWGSRQVTPEAAQLAKGEMEAARRFKDAHKDVFAVVGDKTENFLGVIYHHINPLSYKSPEKGIIAICGFLAISFLYEIFSDFSFFLIMFEDIANWDISLIFWILPYLFLPLTIYCFYKKSPVGWAMLAVWSTYVVTSMVFSFGFLFRFSADGGSNGISGLLNSVMPVPSLYEYFFTLLIHGGILYFINKRFIKQIFTVSRFMAVLCIGLTTLIVSIQWLAVYL